MKKKFVAVVSVVCEGSSSQMTEKLRLEVLKKAPKWARSYILGKSVVVNNTEIYPVSYSAKRNKIRKVGHMYY